MSLLDLLKSDDPAVNNGLLNFGLSLMRSKGNFGNAVGEAGVAGQLGARDFRRQQELLKRSSITDQLLQMQLSQQQQAAEQQAKMQALAQKYQRTPAQQAMAQNGGPTIAAANAIPNTPAGFDYQGYVNELPSVAGPVAALQMQALMQKDAPQPIKLGAGDLLLDPKTYKPLANNPKAEDINPNKPFLVINGQVVPNKEYQDYEMRKARAGASSTSVSYGAPVAGIDSKGNPIFIQPSKDGSPPAVIPGVRPPKSAAEERADQDRNQRGNQAKQMLSVLSDAEQILAKGTPTASGIGTAVDVVARGFGATTPGAQDAARLSSLSGWLVANVPRMEGPQSNYDVQNYMTMAGKVGDSTVPRAERLAALREVRKLQQKYAEINGTPVEQPATNAPRRYNPDTGKIE